MHVKRLIQKHYAGLSQERLSNFTIAELRQTVLDVACQISKSLATNLYWATRGFVYKYHQMNITNEEVEEDVMIKGNVTGLQIPQNISAEKSFLE